MESKVPPIIEAFKNHLRENPDSQLSISFFCKEFGVTRKAADQWLFRQGLNARIIRYEVLMEKCGFEKEAVLESLANSTAKRQFELESKPSHHLSLDKRIRGVTLDFPDGTRVLIKETSPNALTTFIGDYNKMIDPGNV
jgi:hypothetical protein